ncbi:TetR/AcrR family transcriptional regulator [Nonomuraea soli]|uniref:AcrR family transcriptional regulator n=1 Tax=Nonomuraea soli TaxID=1032476 RepID=A0A7W0HQ63_9ACTN|nr:TetR family transcriptional regulator [Nonomuraea soli]MBA2891578.1 AcrR family transcriptional regulator [Nonomuraea soli]
MSPTRAERRAASEQRILEAARLLFAERGFERTTIRAVATAAQVDPALVMQRFGSKQELFTRAVEHTTAQTPQEDDPVEHVLGTLGWKLGELPPESLAMLRSMLTHPEAASTARAALAGQIERIGSSLGGDDASLRAALMTVIMLGVTVGHQLLELEELRDVPPEEIARLLRPCLQELAR